MKIKCERLVSMICALALCAGLIPAAVSAEEPVPATPESAVEAAPQEEAPAERAPAEEPAAQEPPAEPAPQAAVDAAAPTVAGMSVAGSTATVNPDGSIYLAMPNDTILAGEEISLTASEAVDFTANASPAAGDLYVVSASGNSAVLAFNLSAGGYDLNSPAYQITLTTADHITWTGSFPDSYNFSVSTLGVALTQTSARLASGAMTARDSGASSAAMSLVYNQDNATALLVGCAEGTTLYSVTYSYTGGTYTLQLPAGAPLYPLSPVLNAGESIAWYNDAAFTDNVDFAAQTVSGNVTLYGEVTSQSTASDFGTQLTNGDAVLYIDTADDWTTFTQRSGEVTAAQRVELRMDVDGGGASLPALTFKGSFNGNGHTISNYRFTASGDNAGLFASLGGGSVVANLNFTGISVSSATYSGVLAGSVSGGEGNNVLVQNVQVRDCSVTGRSAGGLAGFAIWAEIRYCSVADSMTITGIVNGGGLVGISYAQIHDCYSNVTPTALITRGGIVGRNLEGGHIEHCWCTYRSVYGSTDSTSTAVNNVTSVTATTAASSFTAAGFSSDWWTLTRGTTNTFTGNVYYNNFATA